MAEQTDQTKLALMSQNIQTIMKSQDKVESILTTLPNTYLSLKDHNEFVLAVDKRFTEVEATIKAEASKDLISKWVDRTTIAGVSIIGTYLLMFFLQHK